MDFAVVHRIGHAGQSGQMYAEIILGITNEYHTNV